MNKLLNKLFISNAWTVGFRQIENKHVALPDNKTQKVKYNMLTVGERYYYADPFIVEENGKVFLFVEMMDRFRAIGSIAVSELKDNKFGKFKEIIREPFHLSYPNVFKYKDEFYMIPESSANNEIRLYKAISFPYEWKYEKTLIDGKPFVDTSIIVQGDVLVLYTCFVDKNGNNVCNKYYLSLNSFTLIEADDYTLLPLRPAGNPVIIDEVEYRPLQDCEGYYGKGIIWGKFKENSEEKFGYLSFTSFDMKPPVDRVTGTHTINRSEHYEVVDIRYNRTCVLKMFIKTVRRLKRSRPTDDH